MNQLPTLRGHSSLRLALWLSVACPVGALAQGGIPDSGASKQIHITRIDVVPVIDGSMDEDVWSRAVLVEDLHQLEPVEYAAPSQPTEIRLYYDDNALYIAARLWDTEAERITAQVLRQGEGLASEDRFAVILDPYLDRRNGYRFQVNPNGVRWEALYQDTSNLESNWDGIWLGAATRDAEGWTAEMAIPFKTLSFNPNTADWGINFERTIQRNGETLGWVSRNRQLNPGVAGTAIGFSGLQHGVGLDVVPSLTVGENKVYGAAGGGSTDFEPSLDIFYKLTPSLNGALTLNTDFSATEVDDRQVNLTRFNLFFPEKRDFFLQDADIFEFGRIGSGGFNQGGGGGGGGGGNPAIPGAAAQNGRPFFSRTLGLSEIGEPVDIQYGAKLSGRAGRWNIGALAIHQDEFDNVEAGDVFVGRLSANVLGESALGMIVTDGDPQSNLDNTLAGADFRYRNSRLPGGRLLEGQAWLQQTDSEGIDGDDRAFGLGVSMPNSAGWRGSFSTRQVEENFNPAVGFVDRVGVRDYAADFGFQRRFVGRWLRSLYRGFDGYRVERLDTGGVESQVFGFRLTMQNNTQDNIFTRAVANREVLREDFAIYTAADGSRQVIIPAGDYTFTDYRVGLDSGDQRSLALRFAVSWGEFYAGDRIQPNVEFGWRPSEHFRLGLNYQVNDIELPQGDFMVRLSSLRLQLVFSSTLSWVNLIQYDNLSETVGINSRLHWIPQAGREGFIVLNHNLADRDQNDSFHSTNADMSVKFSYTWRY
ncbi:MAG TPA: carbohydrate binding family 9 domain-containing protein [Gammaproteobacteria bacterium]|nr:carbohydrate binding family 9 domain-containing protein [Gammaproteobacteria bacterium]